MSKSNFMAALEKSFENDCRAISELDIPQLEVSKEFQKKMSKLIERQKKSYFKLICTASRRVACIVVIILVLFASSLSVKAVRNALHDFFMSVFSDHTEISVDIDDINDYPESIETEYMIDDIPEGFELTEYSENVNSVCYYYKKGNSFIFFEQTVRLPDSYDIDNEDASIEYYTDNGQKYFIHTLDKGILAIWDNGDYILRIASNLDKKTILYLCKCTKKIEI